MVTVPVLNNQVAAQGTPSATFRYNVPDVPTDGVEGAFAAVNKLVADEKQRADETALMDAQMKADAWEANNIFDPTNGALAKKGKDAFDVPRLVGEKYDQEMGSIRDSLTSNEQKMAFQKFMVQRRSSLSRTLETHARAQMDDFEKNVVTAETDSSINRAMLHFNNPPEVEDSINRAKAAQVRWGKRQGLPEAAITDNMMKVESKARLGVLSRWADNDDKGAVEYFEKNKNQFFGEDIIHAQKLVDVVGKKYKATEAAGAALASVGPKADEDSIITYVMNDLEGGDKLVQDGKGLAKFGINSTANPDVNVAELTEEKAREIYKNKYWKSFKPEQLDPQMRLVAFDAYINGFDKNVLGKSLDDAIKEADGDPRKLLKTREEYYRKLAEQPDKAGSLKGWLGRLSKVSAQVSSMTGETPSLTELYAHIDRTTKDADVADAAKQLAKKQVDAMQADQKNREENASKEAWRYMQSNQDVPPSVIAKMNPKEAMEMQKGAPVDPDLYENTRNAIIMGDRVDLEPLKWRLGSNYNELLKLQSDPIQKSEASIIDRVVKQNTRIVLGRSADKNDNIATDDDRVKINQFRTAISNEIRAEEKRLGRPLSVEQVGAVADKMLFEVEVKGSWFDTDKRLFELGENDDPLKVVVPGIPEGREYVLGGAKLSSFELMRKISQRLMKKGLPVTEENISSERAALMRPAKGFPNGILVEKVKK